MKSRVRKRNFASIFCDNMGVEFQVILEFAAIFKQ